ncbi:MAG TPA: hypothetical protein VKW06_04525 [Candidatus Angelobacter sp.]|nr:hypothetical protein [Candidatus Angelobacter sp.]
MVNQPNLAMSQRPLHFVTLSGVPINVNELRWPFHASTSGSDWLVLHGRVELLGSKEDLHVEVAVAMTQTMKDALGSLAQEHAEGLVINSIRKTIDNGQLAFVKSGKLQPVHVTSRFYSFMTRQIQFPTQAEKDVQELIKRRVFWLSSRLGGGAPVEIAHPYDCQYVNYSKEKMLETAREVSAEGLIAVQSDHAVATEKLLQQEEAILNAAHKGVEAGNAATKITA